MNSCPSGEVSRTPASGFSRRGSASRRATASSPIPAYSRRPRSEPVPMVGVKRRVRQFQSAAAVFFPSESDTLPAGVYRDFPSEGETSQRLARVCPAACAAFQLALLSRRQISAGRQKPSSHPFCTGQRSPMHSVIRLEDAFQCDGVCCVPITVQVLHSALYRCKVLNCVQLPMPPPFRRLLTSVSSETVGSKDLQGAVSLSGPRRSGRS